MRTKKSILVTAIVASLALSSFGQAPAQSERPAATERKSNDKSEETESASFVFGGGSLLAFTGAIHNHYGVDLLTEATVPSAWLDRVQVPKMRLDTKAYSISPEFLAPLFLFNDMERKGVPGLGKWVFASASPVGLSLPADAIVYVPPTASTGGEMKVRAFDTTGIPPETVASIAVMAREQIMEREERKTNEDAEIRGRGFHIHERASIVIATGNDAYLDLVSNLIEIYKNRKNETSK